MERKDFFTTLTKEEIIYSLENNGTIYMLFDKKIENIILENYNYEVPEIICYDINDGNLKYLFWIDETTKEI